MSSRLIAWLILIGVVVLGLPVLNFVLKYLCAPIVIWRKSRQSANPQFDETALDQLPPEISEAFVAAARSLAADGFTAGAHLTRQADWFAGRSYVSIWTNAATRDLAQIIAVRVPRPDGTVKALPLLGFFYMTADGRRIVTSNNRSPSIFKPDPKADSAVFSKIGDARQLYRIHRARVARSPLANEPGVLPEPGREADWLRATNRLELDRQVEAGYYAFDPEENV